MSCRQLLPGWKADVCDWLSMGVTWFGLICEGNIIWCYYPLESHALWASLQQNLLLPSVALGLSLGAVCFSFFELLISHSVKFSGTRSASGYMPYRRLLPCWNIGLWRESEQDRMRVQGLWCLSHKQQLSQRLSQRRTATTQFSSLPEIRESSRRLW